jgi:DtxR family Mn-dependent transcriptional regulator
MTLRQRLAQGLGWNFASTWQDSCAAGAPVPAEDGCAGLDCDSLALTMLKVGERGTVSCLQQPGSPAAWKLAAMGVLPGAALTVLQRYPAFVFRIGHAEFAVDSEMAQHVRVHRL